MSAFVRRQVLTSSRRCRTPIPILDKLGRIFGICAGRPGDADWDASHRNAARDVRVTGDKCTYPKPKPNACKIPRRGDFPALATGVSYGGGQVVSRSPFFKRLIR